MLSIEELKLKLSQHQIDRESLEELWEVDGARVYGLTVDGDDAIDLWNRLHQIVAETGYSPVVLGDRDEEVANHLESIEFISDSRTDNTIERILERSTEIDPDSWFANTASNRREDLQEFWEGSKYVSFDKEETDPLTFATTGEWNDTIEPNDRFRIPYDRYYEPLDKVVIALAPTTASWQTFAFLKFGSWNECPAPDEHIAIAKSWHDRYGAEVVGITHDIVEMKVVNPPLDRETAFRLAQEQYIYCSDIVEQGVQTLNNLSATLLGAKVWYFWWD